MHLKYLWESADRHGKPRRYVRRYGKLVRIREPPGTPAFAKAYAAAVERLDVHAPPPEGVVRTGFPRGTLGWLATKYFASEEFRGLAAKSQSNRRSIIEECLREPHKDDDPEPMGFCPLVHLAPRHVQRLRDLKSAAGLPGAANNRKKYISAMCAWAVDGAKPPLLSTNPCRDVRKIKTVTEGFHQWSLEELRRFEARWPVGTKPRLALALLLFTGARRQDMVTFGRQHVRDGCLRYTPQKMRYQRIRMVEKPWLPCLEEVVAASPTGDLTFLVTQHGKPYSAAGFGNWWRECCDDAGLKECAAHGLRKLGATTAAENGATVHELMAIFDWSNPAQAKVYTDAADRKRLAAKATALLIPQRR